MSAPSSFYRHIRRVDEGEVTYVAITGKKTEFVFTIPREQADHSFRCLQQVIGEVYDSGGVYAKDCLFNALDDLIKHYEQSDSPSAAAFLLAFKTLKAQLLESIK